MSNRQDVYIVTCDYIEDKDFEKRIDGIYTSEKKAKNRVKYLNENANDNYVYFSCFYTVMPLNT